jgi:N utilization substance protein A
MGALGGERIDIIEWSEDTAAFIKEALSPATILEVELDEADHRATVTVSEDQQSLAIGRGGQNVRLAAKLTGWNIDINSVGGPTVAESEGVADDIDPAVEEGVDVTEVAPVVEETEESSALTVEDETNLSDDGTPVNTDEDRDITTDEQAANQA